MYSNHTKIEELKKNLLFLLDNQFGKPKLILILKLKYKSIVINQIVY